MKISGKKVTIAGIKAIRKTTASMEIAKISAKPNASFTGTLPILQARYDSPPTGGVIPPIITVIMTIFTLY